MDMRERLLHNNPFVSSAAAEPWVNAAPDIPSLNREVSDRIFYLVENKALRPRDPMAGLILGEAGTGKTHMLKRILDRIRKQDIDAVFVSVKAFSTPERVMRDLWCEIFVNLTKGRSDKLSQFDFIVEKMMDVYRKRNKAKNEAKNKAKNEAKGKLRFDKEGVDFFQNLLPGIHEDFLKAVFAYYDGKAGESKKSTKIKIWLSRPPFLFFRNLLQGIHKDFLKAVSAYYNAKNANQDEIGLREEKSKTALKWLRGSIDDEHHGLLGVEDRNKMSPAELEGEAKNLILSLGLVLDCCKIPMVLCFDQLDGMVSNDLLIKKWGDAVSFLINHTYGILPLAFLKEGIWRRTFNGLLDISVIQKMGGELIGGEEKGVFLKNCTLEQARELIRVRIAPLFPEEAENVNQWVLNQLGEKLEQDLSPRMILELANHAIASPEKNFPPVADVLARTYKEEYDKVAADFDIWPPNTEHLLHALEPYLIYHAGFKDVQRPRDNKYISLVGQGPGEGGDDKPHAFIINTAENNKTVWAAFRRGVAFLKEQPDGICYYITDERCAFPGPKRWGQVHKELKKFKELKGILIFLDRTRAIDWYALTALRFKLSNGDVTLMTSTEGQRTAGEGDLALYLNNGFGKNLLEKPTTGPSWDENSDSEDTSARERAVADPPPSPPPPDDLEKHICAILCDSPMHLMKVALLFGHLHSAKVSITYDRLLEFLRERNDVFALYLSGDSIVQLIR